MLLWFVIWYFDQLSIMPMYFSKPIILLISLSPMTNHWICYVSYLSVDQSYCLFYRCIPPVLRNTMTPTTDTMPRPTPCFQRTPTTCQVRDMPTTYCPQPSPSSSPHLLPTWRELLCNNVLVFRLNSNTCRSHAQLVQTLWFTSAPTSCPTLVFFFIHKVLTN